MGERCPRMHVTVWFLSPAAMMKTQVSRTTFFIYSFKITGRARYLDGRNIHCPQLFKAARGRVEIRHVKSYSQLSVHKSAWHYENPRISSVEKKKKEVERKKKKKKQLSLDQKRNLARCRRTSRSAVNKSQQQKKTKNKHIYIYFYFLNSPPK